MPGDTIRSIADEELQENEKGLVARTEILEHWNVRNKHILDIGAGFLAIFAARDFNCTVTTIDVAEDKLQEARQDAEREGLTEKIVVEHADATALSYADKSFEVVIGYGILHHIEPDSRMKLIREAVRVAKEKVIIAELNAAGFEKIHEADDFAPVDPAWLERIITSFGEVEKYHGRLMDVYVLFPKNV